MACPTWQQVKPVPDLPQVLEVILQAQPGWAAIPGLKIHCLLLGLTMG